MRLSRRGVVAVAMVNLFFGAETGVEASKEHAWRSRQDMTIQPEAFSTTWDSSVFGAPAALNQSFNIEYTVTSGDSTNQIQSQSDQGKMYMVLLWTNAAQGTTPDSSTTFEVIDVQYSCKSPSDGAPSACSFAQGHGGSAVFAVSENPSTQQQWTQNPGNFFMCFATQVAGNTMAQYCETFSPYFHILPPGPPPSNLVSLSATPSGVLTVTKTSQVITSSGVPATTAVPNPASTSSGSTRSFVTISTPPTSVVTVTPTPTSNSTSSFSSTSKSVLSTGAIAGIAVGGGVVLLGLIALLAFCCIRRRRQTKEQPEQVLLSDNVHESRDLITEKDENSTVDSAAGTTVLGSALDSRSSPEPYESHLDRSASYHGAAAAIPKRPARMSQTEAPEFSYLGAAVHRGDTTKRRTSPGRDNVASDSSHGPLIRPTHSRGPSDSSRVLVPESGPSRSVSAASNAAAARPGVTRGVSETSIPISTRSAFGTAGGDFHEPYSDEPAYSRPTAQFPGALQVLSEPGMTAEELQRLEEEERAIDAAIAEAEARR